MFSEVIAIAEITPIVKTRIRVVFILFSPFLNVLPTSSASTEDGPLAQGAMRNQTILVFDGGSQLLQRHITARDIIPSPSSVKAGTCRTRKLPLLLSRDVQATVL